MTRLPIQQMQRLSGPLALTFTLALAQRVQATDVETVTLEVPVFPSNGGGNVFEHAGDFPRYDVFPAWAGLKDEEIGDKSLELRSAVMTDFAALVRPQVAATLAARIGQEVRVDSVSILIDESTTMNDTEGDIAWQVTLRDGAAWKGRCGIRPKRVSEFMLGTSKTVPHVSEASVQVDYWTTAAEQLETDRHANLMAQQDRSAALTAIWEQHKQDILENFDYWLAGYAKVEIVEDTQLIRINPHDLDRLHIAVKAVGKQAGGRRWGWWRAKNIFTGTFSIEVPEDIKKLEDARSGDDVRESMNTPTLKVQPTDRAWLLRHRGRMYRIPPRLAEPHSTNR